MDREAWRAAIHGVTKSPKRLSNWTEKDNLAIAILGLWASHCAYNQALLCKWAHLIIEQH